MTRRALRDYVSGLRPGTGPPGVSPTVLPPAASLREPGVDADLRRDGFAVVDLLDGDEVAALFGVCQDVHPEPRSTWDSDFYHPSPEVKRLVHEAISGAIAPHLDRLFVGHRSVMHNFVVNWPGPDGGLVLHQHPSMVDERRFRSVVVWCALTEATEANGTLHVVPRSHLVQSGPQPEPFPSWCLPHTRRLLADHLVSVPLRPGQAIVLDNQVLHCSFPNVTDAPRMAAAAIVIPSSAEPLFFEATDRATVRVHTLDPAFFLDNEAGHLRWARPKGVRLIEERDWVPTVVDDADLDALLPRGTCSHTAS